MTFTFSFLFSFKIISKNSKLEKNWGKVTPRCGRKPLDKKIIIFFLPFLEDLKEDF